MSKPSSWIEQLTGKDGAWWVSEVQRLVAKHTRPTKDPRHGSTETGMVLTEIIGLVQKHGMPRYFI